MDEASDLQRSKHPLSLLAVAVFCVGVAVSIVAYVAASQTVELQENQLLERSAKEVGSFLNVSLQSANTGLRVLSREVPAPGDPQAADQFSKAAGVLATT